MRPIAFVSGKYSAATQAEIDDNVRQAREVGKALMFLGYSPFIPHANSYGMEHETGIQYEEFLDADIAMLERCDILVLFGDYLTSYGSVHEVEFAEENGIAVYKDIGEVPPADELERDTTQELIRLAYDRRRKGLETYPQTLRPFKCGDMRTMSLEESFDLNMYQLTWLLEQRAKA